jgi:two-component system CAI-1 autoinducer sensor kinase/phosphatase CqsS
VNESVPSTPNTANAIREDTTSTRLRGSVWSRVARWLREEVITSPLVPVLHPTPLRIKGLGLFTVIGHPLFWWVWAVLLPQPYENLGLRIFTGSLGLLLISNRISRQPSSVLAGQVFSAVIWFELPFLFSYMYLCNGGNAAWLSSMAAMILIYYFVTDWRIATLGLAAAALLAGAVFELWGPAVPAMETTTMLTGAMVILFCVSMGLLLGLSSANLRREQLNHTLTTMGIMAHELRTPLATMSLIGDAVRNEARQARDAGSDQRFDQLVVRLHSMVRTMNQQIDTQIVNAGLQRLPTHKEAVTASELLRHVVRDYPYRNSRERDSVVLVLRKDFTFESSGRLFTQVINNLLKNAFRSLAAGSSSPKPGDLRIEVGVLNGSGRIFIEDQGVGIAPELQTRIFEPFFSTDYGTGHGLGLAFCQQVVQSAHGSIRVKSEPGRGALFIIELPVLTGRMRIL